MLKLAIMAFGYRVLEAPDGKRAVEITIDHKPDLILMDLAMPVLKGVERPERFAQTTIVAKHLSDEHRQTAMAVVVMLM